MPGSVRYAGTAVYFPAGDWKIMWILPASLCSPESECSTSDGASPANTTDGELWKPLYGCENYEVSDLGRVRHVRRKAALKFSTIGSGYLAFGCQLNGRRATKYVHRAVLESHVGPCPDGLEARHLNGDKTDNRLSNLEWSSHMENCSDKKRHGTSQHGEAHNMAILSESQVVEILSSTEKAKSAAVRYGVSVKTIYNIRKRRTWKHL